MIIYLDDIFNFIQGFNKIVATLISILKTARPSITLVSRADDNEIIGSGTKGGISVGKSDTSRKKLTESKSWNSNSG